jgi:hypothetical protein
MEIKYMTIAVDNGLYCAEYYESAPNDWYYKDGESTPPEGYRYWHSAFDPIDNSFKFRSEQELLPFVRADISVKSYPDYDIRVMFSKSFD